MKISAPFKLNLALTFLLLYVSGALYWLWIARRDQQIEFEPPPLAPLLLHVHAITGLWAMMVFGYLFRSHIQPALKTRKRRPTGSTTLGLFVLLIATVPGLFYLADEGARSLISSVHTYSGLAVIAPVFFHSFGLRFTQRRSTNHLSTKGIENGQRESYRYSE